MSGRIMPGASQALALHMKAHPARAGRAVKPRTRKVVREAQGCRSSDRCETGLLGADATAAHRVGG
jgi:hypothetical protein